MNRDHAQLSRALEDVEVNETLFAKLLKHSGRQDGSLKPEGEVRVAWVVKFIRDYGYDSRKIDIEVPAGRVGRAAESKGSDTVFADIVIYRDLQHTEPYIVMETKRPDEKGGLRQAESYARNLGAEYHMWHDGKDAPKHFRTARFAQKSEAVGDIPSWIGD